MIRGVLGAIPYAGRDRRAVGKPDAKITGPAVRSARSVAIRFIDSLIAISRVSVAAPK